ncbi:MAG: ABC transporter permease subunit [Thermoplasmatales archaeon]|nr:ABC transporter permease subunit [Thermoplasmatales archaeon]
MNAILLVLFAVLATAGRVLGLILLSIVIGWLLAYAAIKGRIFENIYISLIEVFESVPVISFFPIVLIIFVDHIGGVLGVELAADFLVFTAVVWNIWIAEYQAFKTLPKEMEEVIQNYRMGFFSKMRYLYIPFSIPRISANLFPSVSDGFFYITVSEVFAIGVHTYSTFGIGSVLSSFISSSNTDGIILSLVTLGAVVVLIVLGMREYAKKAVAKYTLDTDAPIVRRGRFSFRQTSRLHAVSTINPLSRIARYSRNRASQRMSDYKGTRRTENVWRYAWASVGVTLLLLIGYAAFNIVSSVKMSEWTQFLSTTPQILVGLVYDYARVATILVISFVISISLGYYLAVNKRAESIGVPVMQTFSAYPVPIYFPFIFAASLPFIVQYLGPFSDEFYVLAVGFVSTFYYIFYSFWMGVKSLPVEYFELMRNLNLGYFSKLRRIVLPATFPYLISGISSTINSAWGGLMIAEYWPDIIHDKTLEVHTGLMKFISVQTSSGNIGLAGWASFIFGIVVVIYSILFTRRMMDLARKRYVAEEGIFAA